jgi:DNA-binding GntR family transcriptional regulator
MNSGATSERVYDALKRRILHRAFRPGDRLDPAVLGDTLGSSVTPVRDALNILTGEGLVETRTGEGFHLPQVTEPDLRDLYAWNGEILGLALRHRAGVPVIPPPRTDDQPEAVAAQAAALFAAIAAASANAEHGRAIAVVNDRLHGARLAEPQVLGDATDDLDAIVASATPGPGHGTSRLVVAYHRRRQRAAAELVRAIYRAG